MTVTYHGVTHLLHRLPANRRLFRHAPKELRGNFYFAANRLLVDKVHQRVYASISNPPAVAVLDVATLKVNKTIPVEGELFGMALSADAKKLYVAEASDEGPVIGVISTSTPASLVSVPAPTPSKDVAVGLSFTLAPTGLTSSTVFAFDVSGATPMLLKETDAEQFPGNVGD